MQATFEHTMTAPFVVGGLVARAQLAGEPEARGVLRSSHFRGMLEDIPTRAARTDAPAPTLDQPRRPDGMPAEFRDVLGIPGLALPKEGRTTIPRTRNAPCHATMRASMPAGTCYDSWEHELCACLVGKDKGGQPLVSHGVGAWFDVASPLTVGRSTLTFGEIMALAGDFYAHLDDAAANAFAWAWPEAKGLVNWVAGDYRATTLAGDAPEVRRAILNALFRDKDQNGGVGPAFQTVIDGVFGPYPTRRYLALASQNFCHFATQPPNGILRDADNEALRLYRAYHMRALTEAVLAAETRNRRHALESALVTDAFACHFLTDLFASGHLRVPRRILSERFGMLQGALHMAAAMHREDNLLGLWCTPRIPRPHSPRVVWRAYGDGALRSHPARIHRVQVQEAVRRSVAELFAVHVAATRGSPMEDALATIAPHERVEALLPVLLPAGAMPQEGDLLPDAMTPAPHRQPNPWPRYWLLSDGRLAERLAGPDNNTYVLRNAQGRVIATVVLHG